MKAWLLLSISVIILVSSPLKAAWIDNQPLDIRQPDGRIIHCFVSGDEYYNWLHDADGYTIIQGSDGYFYYGIISGDDVVPSCWKAGLINPDVIGLARWSKISGDEYQKRKALYGNRPGKSVNTPHSGVLNNLVIFIRFSDDAEFTDSRSFYETKFNLDPGISLQNYYEEVSYGKLSIQSTSYPACIPSVNLSYQDSHPRSYFLPYNATANPNGYVEGNDRTLREHALLRDAVNWINSHSPVPTSLNIDKDNDGLVDNITFLVRGGTGGWSSLLWAHSWSLFSYTVNINGKQVFNYTFHPETQTDVGTICHEMFHSLGAPDLYHYVNSSLQPVQSWDLMDNGFGHMGAYMKWKYSSHTWIDSIPAITASGTYSLNPLETATGNCYKINSLNSSYQYYVLEYRKKTGMYESNVPGSGLLIYRINPYYSGNSTGPPDEVYIYRPGGTVSLNGDPSFAYYTSEEGRDSLSDGTTPSGFLDDGLPGGLIISNVSSAGTTIHFDVTLSNTIKPLSFSADAISTSQINLMWTKNPYDDPVLLAYSTTPFAGNPNVLESYSAGDILPGGGIVLYQGPASGFSHTGLQSSTHYYYRLWSVGSGLLYSAGIDLDGMTKCILNSYPYAQYFNEGNIPDCWTTQTNINNLEAWRVTPTSAAGGSPYELTYDPYVFATGYSRIIMVPFNTVGITKLNVSFRLLNGYFYSGATLKLQSSTDMINWSDESWAETSNNNPTYIQEFVQTTVEHSLNSPVTYLAISVIGNLEAQGNVHMDNFDVSIAECNFFIVNAAASPQEGGIVSGAGNYYPGQVATLSATAYDEWNFLYWTVNDTIVSYQPDYSFVVERDRNVVAVFSQTRISILLETQPPGSGELSGNGIYLLYQPVDISTVANEGYEFTGWTESGTSIATTPDYSFSALGSRDLVANYEHLQVTMEVVIHPGPAGSASGQGIHNYGDTVQLNALPNEGYQFVGWFEDGNLVSSLADYSLIMKADMQMEARFICPVCSVIVAAEPADAGLVNGGGSYPSGGNVTVEASPKDGWLFDAWKETGTTLSSNPVYSFIVDHNRNLVARFLQLYTITAEVIPTNSGEVIGSGPFITGGHCTLLAIPDSGYSFNFWSENGDSISSENILDFTVSANRLLQAHFKYTNGINQLNDDPILVYPNPADEVLTVEFPSIRPIFPNRIEIYDSQGKLVRMQQINSLDRSVKVNLSKCINGYYTLKFCLGGTKLFSRKVLIMK
ncbi:MAG: M6 family metalloprotease domain-containing protein [Bacteroidetes bacterium]|nr:M6 family metalloprotease domain-containing protein [Bacteroidota bacterium]